MPLNIIPLNEWKNSNRLTNDIYRINIMDTIDVNNSTTDVDVFLVVALHSLNWQIRQLIGATPLFALTHVWCIVSPGTTQPRTTSVRSPTGKTNRVSQHKIKFQASNRARKINIITGSSDSKALMTSTCLVRQFSVWWTEWNWCTSYSRFITIFVR